MFKGAIPLHPLASFFFVHCVLDRLFGGPVKNMVRKKDAGGASRHGPAQKKHLTFRFLV